ncbi:putative chorismate mutase [Halobacteriovorax marinus SJ]|uniref:chorismate mutase n=1 Tax=Halobacteriovorax marinus (strain ATCC BAA-682 / DSM 15412 / SJ) TaxID=862908 RepID=E1WXF3_HALMS|nr:chorismate mutase [Halobacteriovorax marinus]CBW27470.1 putative chorismate mutase [Halobacteriovorax marinus SJ]
MDFLPLNKWLPNLKRPLVIAGPCSAESHDQMLSTAREIAKIPDVRIFRAGIWKPRTRPNCFEGVGEEGLKWLSDVKAETGLLTTTEVANTQHVELALKHGVDILWIGARTTVSPFAVQEIADALKGTNIPVMVKNPVNQDLALWIGALERIAGSGINKIAAIHRGFSTGDTSKYRNLPLWKIPIELKSKFQDLPIICDPSHIAGKRDLIAYVCQKAMDADMEGLMVETHIDPTKALSDAAQQVTPEALGAIIEGLSLRTEFGVDRTFEQELDALRGQVDRVDQEILEALKTRTEIIKKIGEAKKEKNIMPLQIQRMDELMKKRIDLGKDLGLTETFVKDIYDTIHSESVRIQSQIVNDFDSKK